MSGALFASGPAAGETAAAPALLTDPFLQLPTEDSVRVVWFTEFEGSDHHVLYGEDLDKTAPASSTRLSRTAEDQFSRVGDQVEDGQVYNRTTPRRIWRHEARVAGLEAGARVPYRVSSTADDGSEILGDAFTLQPLPRPGEPLKILLTSDHQLKPLTPANLQKAVEAVGRIDAVFFAGDLVNVPDRASEWFDDNRGLAFFPALQGKADYRLDKSSQQGGATIETSEVYTGGEIIQNAPLFPVIGNHEVTGRYSPANHLDYQFNDPRPRAVAEAAYEANAELFNPRNDPEVRSAWIEANSFNTVTYEELFTLPEESPGGETYYSLEFGDVYLIGLYATRIWRTPRPSTNARSKYQEPERYLNIPQEWGHGDFIFEDLSAGSEQLFWLQDQLASDAFRNARYKIVLMHQGPHGVGQNYNPVFAHPEQIIDRDEGGAITGVRYEYPIEKDILRRDVQPLLEDAGVHLVHMGHSHLWFRMESDADLKMIETSNVGNTYGCYLEGHAERNNGPDDPRYDQDNYAATGDPHGLEPVMPSILSPMQDDAGNGLPCVASDDLTVFSILDTGAGVVTSYVFDTREPDGKAVAFDEFPLIDTRND